MRKLKRRLLFLALVAVYPGADLEAQVVLPLPGGGMYVDTSPRPDWRRYEPRRTESDSFAAIPPPMNLEPSPIAVVPKPANGTAASPGQVNADPRLPRWNVWNPLGPDGKPCPLAQKNEKMPEILTRADYCGFVSAFGWEMRVFFVLGPNEPSEWTPDLKAAGAYLEKTRSGVLITDTTRELLARSVRSYAYLYASDLLYAGLDQPEAQKNAVGDATRTK